MKLDLNFNIKNPDGSEYFEISQNIDSKGIVVYTKEPVSAKKSISNFLLNAAKHEKIDTDKAWEFATQLAKDGVIDTDIKTMEEIYDEYNKSSSIPILAKANIKLALNEAKKKSETEKGE